MSRVNGDPAVEHVRGENDFASKKGRYDGGYTPSEQRVRDGLMKQFCKLPEGSQNTTAYTSAECWCACGRLKSVGDLCRKCADATPLGFHPESQVTERNGFTVRSDPRLLSGEAYLLQLKDWEIPHD